MVPCTVPTVAGAWLTLLCCLADGAVAPPCCVPLTSRLQQHSSTRPRGDCWHGWGPPYPGPP